MLFNSLDFALFLPIVFFLYWFLTKRNLKYQNILIVLASYVFYAWWNWRFLSLIIISTFIDFFVGKWLAKTDDLRKRRLLLFTSILVNLGFLGFFKYFNFFFESLDNAFSLFGVSIRSESLKIILPVGISFYTFQTLSYTIDVYKRKLKPTDDFIAFSAFVSFFPQLVAGPIERATNLLPQFSSKREFHYDQASTGLKMMLWGLFMKVVVADRLALYVDNVYGNIAQHNGISLMLATIFFAIQIYCDFGGYSMIAVGTAKLFGFNLMENFRRPYLSVSFKDFWSRWHISLSTWFRDYVYIPLGGNRGTRLKTNRNLFITFIISGLWHGANWTFVIWGALHGIYQIIEKEFYKVRLPKLFSVFLVFLLTNIAWVFFRVDSLSEARLFFSKLLELSFKDIYIGDIGIFIYSTLAILILLINDIMIEYFPGIKLLNNRFIVVRYSAILLLVILILSLGVFDNSQFIYFQF